MEDLPIKDPRLQNRPFQRDLGLRATIQEDGGDEGNPSAMMNRSCSGGRSL